MRRRDHVRALLTPDAITPMDETPTQARIPSHSVRVMGLEIERLTDAARDAETLRGQIESGAAVVDLDPALIDPSFIADRLAPTDDRDHRRLVESMRVSGQQVPILVRPHMDRPGRYQIAYGHRRREAAAELGLAVKAIVRTLSDTDLVVAQGKENAERRNLSFIERALFASHLVQRGFDRPTLNAALGVHTAEVTRLLAVATAVPVDVARAVGPAPKIGRPRWMDLAQALTVPGANDRLAALLPQLPFRKLDSDRRFDAVLAALRGPDPSAQSEGEFITNEAGDPLIRVEQVGRATRFVVDERLAPALGQYLRTHLRELIARYESDRNWS